LLDSQFAELVEHWRARAQARAAGPVQLDAHLPALLQRLISHLAAPVAEGAAPASGVAGPLSLFRKPFDLEAVVYEYGLLQRVVLELLERASVPVSMRDVRLLGDWFTRAVASAAAEHARVGPSSARADAVDTQRSAGAPAASPRPGPPAALEAAFDDAKASSGDPAQGARQRLRALLEQAPVAVSVLRAPDLVYEFANTLALAMAGGRDVIGKTLREAFPELDDHAPVLELLREVCSSGRAYSADEYVVPLDRRGDGSIENVYFKFTCQPICDDAGRVRDVLVVASDVTASVEARQRIEALLAELTLADQRKDEFLAMLAHELRNPMAAISTALALLDQADGDAERAERYRETARRQMGNLVRLVDDLLDVARITRGKVELRREEVNLATIVQHALAATRATIEARQHELTVTVAPGTFHVSADATRLEQVIVNLLTNAAKYTEPGGSISVLVRREEMGQRPGAWAVVSVRDSGRGIPREMLDKVFDLFTQVSPSIDRNNGGLGLGLTLVKHLMEMHGGSASADSAGPGRGSEFSIRLPLLDGPGAPASEPQPAPATPSRRRRVVVVEDAEDVRELLKECIERLGHEVLVASGGLDGVALIAEARPDIALVDVGLPGIDGYEVARRVRAARSGAAPMLVALTGYGGAEVAKLARDAGFDLHVTKPIEIGRLQSVLEASAATGG
jgi:signal transduction histidine kinase